ncbi:MAG: YdcF family protein, partial [Anaerolineae bacterium]|nr:YdcF family protein [Anaerolineae bacterium]
MQLFYFLSKFLPNFVYPAGLTSLLLIVALLLRKRQRARTIVIALALGTLWLGGNRLTSMILVRSLEWRYPSLSHDPLPRADAIVVLGGGTQEQLPPRPFQEVGEAGDRMIYAAYLFREGVAPTIVVSGARGPLSNPGGVPESEVMAQLLVFFGVPREAIILESTSMNTYENAIETLTLLEQRGLTDIVLVTSAMHMPRSVAIFKKLELALTPAPTDYLLTQSDWDYYTQPNLGIQLMGLLPQA